MNAVFENDKIGMYAIFDQSFDAFNPPFFARSDSEVYKNVRDVLKSEPTSTLTINADIMDIYRVGVFDLKFGIIEPDNVFLKTVSSLKDVNGGV